MEIRKAEAGDLGAVARLYAQIHTAEETGLVSVGWRREVYPTAATAETALDRGELFVQEDGGAIVGTGIINQRQAEAYRGARWRYPAPDDQVLVLHTLVIAPDAARKGRGRAFVAFYEDRARSNGCLFLRLDTNERNTNARALYGKLGYAEVEIVPCVFNGLENVHLVLLEKKLEA